MLGFVAKASHSLGINVKKMILALSVLVSTGAFASCEKIEAAIQKQLKEAAYQDAKGFLDNSAPRQTMRNAAITALMAQSQLLLSQAIAQKCPLSKSPYDYSLYYSAASSCNLAKSSEEIKERCNQNDWKQYSGE